MINRIKQAINYMFSTVKTEDLDKIKSKISIEEYDLFVKMDLYDQIHSIDLYKKVLKDDMLKDDRLYRKLALLHDCGKSNISLFKRIKSVIVEEEILENHPKLGCDKLESIDSQLAELVATHHANIADEKLKRFQQLDDRS